MLSIILPTYNEAGNIDTLLDGIVAAMDGRAFEVIVVDDDSPDKTWEKAELLSGKHPFLRVCRRIGRRGLSSAAVEGFDHAKGDILLVMDSDLQHDPAVILALEQRIRDGADIAVASRYIEGGSVGEWVKGRRMLSNAATFLAGRIPSVSSSDPMSGFFAIRASAYRSIRPHLHPTGFKILLEILAFLPRGTRIAEVPLVFRMRQAGESKLSLAVEAQFLFQLLRIILRRFQWHVFIVAVLIALVLLLPRFFVLLPLYLHPQTRENVQAALERTAEERGWLLSGMHVVSLDNESVTVVYRMHHRGPDERTCVVLPFHSNAILPCER